MCKSWFPETSYFQKFRRKTKLYQWTWQKSQQRWGKVEEISELEFFAMENSSYITGQSINIDGVDKMKKKKKKF